MTKSELIEKLQNVNNDATIRIASANGVYDIDSVVAMADLVNIIIAE